VRPLTHDDAAAFARISHELLAEPASENTLRRVVDLAVQTIGGCDFAGVTLKHNGRLDTPAATDHLVDQLDQAQYDLNEGPCVDAVRHDDSCLLVDTSSQSRWPRWAPVAAEAGIGSVFSIRLESPQHVVGALNLYSRAVDGFDQEAQLTGRIYAMHAGNAIYAASEVENLAIAMRTRHLIGLAQGMLMLRYGLDEDQAFRFLTRHSQERNLKLRTVAEDVVNELRTHRCETPSPGPRAAALPNTTRS
jgi:transcriptional regulator with GAF, ATPase, and Fis domain